MSCFGGVGKTLALMAFLVLAFGCGAEQGASGTSEDPAASSSSAQSSPEPAAPSSSAVAAQTAATARAAAASAPAPTELVVRFQSGGTTALTECAERWFNEGRAFKDATADHSPTLDSAFRKWGIRSAHALLRSRVGLSTRAAVQAEQAHVAAVRAKFPQRTPHTATITAASEMANVYVLPLGKGIDAEAAARDLAKDPAVVYAQPNYRMKSVLIPNDPFFSSSNSWGQGYADLWGLTKLDTATAWSTTQGAGVVVGVVDSGLDMKHPDIAANVWNNPHEICGNGIDDDNNGFVDDCNGWNFVAGNNNPTDDNGHGTHVSGTIAAIGNNGIDIIGVAPQAHIMPIKALDATGTGTSAAIAAAILYGAHNGAQVLNNSYGCTTSCPSNPVEEQAVQQAHDLGVTVVFAAGNASSDIAQFSPQNSPYVITATAFDQNDAFLNFSNFGGLVDVAAPGGAQPVAPPDTNPINNILSLRSSVCNTADICQPGNLVGTDLVRLAGTSMASPHVAGVAALVRAQHPTYTPEQVRQVIRAGATPLGPESYQLTWGYGRVSASGALAQPTPLTALITAPTTQITGVSNVSVVGSAFGTGFASWTLDFGRGFVPDSFTTIATSTTAVNQGTLASWNVGVVPDGTYELRLRAVTTDGRTYEDRQSIVISNVALTSPAPTPLTVVRSGTTVTFKGTTVTGLFSSYSFQVITGAGALLPNPKIALTGGGTAPIVNGILGTWDTTGSPADNYTIQLVVSLTNGESVVQTTHVATDPTLHAGWPVSLGASGSIRDAVTVADVNGDGKPDVLVGYQGFVRVLDSTGAPLPGWPQSIDPSGVGVVTTVAPAVADIDGDGKPDVVASNDQGQVFAWSGSGKLLRGWPVSVGGFPNRIAIDDLLGDGHMEVVVMSDNDRFAVLRGDGTFPGFEIPLEGGFGISPPAIADVNGDGKKEIVVRTTDSVFVFDPSTGNPLPGWPLTVSPSTGFTNSPALGDLDGDGLPDIVVSWNDGSVHAYNFRGAAIAGWPQAMPNLTLANGLAIGDLLGTGHNAVVAGGTNLDSTFPFIDRVFAWSSNGSLLPGWPAIFTNAEQPPSGTSGFSAVGINQAALADVDGNGSVDVVVSGDWFGPPGFALYAFGSNGALVPGFPKITASLAAQATISPAVADIDGDGFLNLVWIDSTNTVYVWDLPARASAKTPWPMFGHDARHTFRADALSTTGSPPAAPTGLTATAGDKQVTLSWTASTGATSYAVARSTTSGTGFVTIAPAVTTTSFLDTGLTDGTTFFYVVKASNAFGTSANSAQVSAKPMAACTPETDAAFCSRLAKNCGAVSGNDNCGQSRTVTSCGTCTAPQTCGGAGTANVCGTASTDPCAGLCANPTVFTGPNYQSGNVGTSAVCRETTATLHGGNCSNISGRTVTVNGVAENCNGWTIPSPRNGGYCIQVTAGTPDFTSFATW